MSTAKKSQIREPLIHLSKRASVNPVRAWAIRIAAVVLGLIVCGLVAFLLIDKLNENPGRIGDFYEAFHLFDTQPVQQSLCSENRIVRLFAVLDRRVGRRTLMKLRDSLSTQTPAFRKLYEIRMQAEAERREEKND